MLHLASTAAFCLAVPSAAPAAAAQDDARLDELFRRLQQTQDSVEAGWITSLIWEVWTETDDEDVSLLMRQGQAALRQHDFATALQRFDAVVAQAPDYAEGGNKRATLYDLIGDFSASIADIKRTLDLGRAI